MYMRNLGNLQASFSGGVKTQWSSNHSPYSFRFVIFRGGFITVDGRNPAKQFWHFALSRPTILGWVNECTPRIRRYNGLMFEASRVILSQSLVVNNFGILIARLRKPRKDIHLWHERIWMMEQAGNQNGQGVAVSWCDWEFVGNLDDSI